MRGIERASRSAIALALLLVTFLGVSSTTSPAVAEPPAVNPVKVRWSVNRPGVIVSVKTVRPLVALSFDDGPDPRYTPRVLEMLAAAGARATFFDEGQHVAEFPALARATVAAGHEIGNHTFSHIDVRRVPQDTVEHEILRTRAIMDRAGVETVPLFRPPKGRFNAVAARAVERTGYIAIGWNVPIERELRNRTDEEAVEAVLALAHPGAIILGHDGGIPNRERTMRVLPGILAGLRARGYQVVTVTELLRDARL